MVSEAKHKSIHGEEFKISTSKWMIQRLPIALAQVKEGNTSENWLNEIRQIIYYLYREKRVTEKVDNELNGVIK